jgi:hypothetical protein
VKKVRIKEQKEIPASAFLSNKGLQDARQLINIFLLAWKNYGLYPADHTSTLKAFENLIAAFGSFFSTHGDLRLTVEKDGLLYDSEPIHEISPATPAEDIITLLYRDGIKWIEFQEGLTPDELASFFKITYKHRSLAEEIEGDIVTALMDEELEYIDFKAVDIFWQDMLLMDFSQLPPPAPQQEDLAEQEEIAQQNEPDQFQQLEGSTRKDTSARSIADPSINAADLELANGDYEILRQMVQEEESWEITENLFELLLIILKRQSEEEKFTAVLGFISEVTVESIERNKFDPLVKLFEALHTLFSLGKSFAQDWQRPLISRFFQDLSRPEIFQLISDELLKIQTNEIEKLKALGQGLHYFTPAVIPFLVPVIIQRSAPEIQQLVSEVIVDLSRRDIGPLEKIAEQHGTELGDKLLDILDRLPGERVNEILFKMCDHGSNKVRRNAIKDLLDRDPRYAQRLFSLIDDPSQEVRACILATIAKHKSSALENMLLNYLQENSTQEDPAHILACYWALGRCGSNLAIPFLRKILLNWGWNSFMGSGKLIFREGAAIALTLLDTPAAKNVLQQASKSRFRVIRKAFAKTKNISGSGENPND